MRILMCWRTAADPLKADCFFFFERVGGNVCGHSLQPMTKCCLLVYPNEQKQLVLIKEESTLEDIYKPHTD